MAGRSRERRKTVDHGPGLGALPRAPDRRSRARQPGRRAMSARTAGTGSSRGSSTCVSSSGLLKMSLRSSASGRWRTPTVWRIPQGIAAEVRRPSCEVLVPVREALWRALVGGPGSTVDIGQVWLVALSGGPIGQRRRCPWWPAPAGLPLRADDGGRPYLPRVPHGAPASHDPRARRARR